MFIQMRQAEKTSAGGGNRTRVGWVMSPTVQPAALPGRHPSGVVKEKRRMRVTVKPRASKFWVKTSAHDSSEIGSRRQP